MWLYGLTNFPVIRRYQLCAPMLTVPGAILCNWPAPTGVTPMCIAHLPGVVFPELYHYQDVITAGPFPGGWAVPPDN